MLPSMWEALARWFGKRPTDTISISSPSVASLFDIGAPNYSGVDISESSSLSLSAVYRAVALIAGTIGTLPLRTVRDTGDGMRQRIGSVFDDPGGQIGLVPFNWTETVLCHLLLHGNAYLKHIYGGAGQLVALLPVHPLLVCVELPRPGDVRQPVGGKWFRLTRIDGTQEVLDATDLTQIMGMSLDGIQGLSVISLARNGFGTALAGDRAAANMFSRGALIAGMVTPDGEDIEPDEAKEIKRGIESSVLGWENASSIPVINKRLKFTPWTMTAQDAQFLESRQFSIREIARWFGIPPHLLMETSAASNWGTGIEQQNLGLARFNLVSWTCRVEQTLSTLLPKPRFVEYDFAGLERPAPEVEIALLISQVQAGLLTLDEARAIRNLPPLEQQNPAQQASNAPVAPATTEAPA
jgi:HK97 family phage portal protein